MSRACCNHNCREGRDCPLRQPRELTRAERFAGWAMVLALAAVLAASLAGCVRADDPGNQSRDTQEVPGVAVYRDYGTGCEYVSADGSHSALTPRMGQEGKQICREALK